MSRRPVLNRRPPGSDRLGSSADPLGRWGDLPLWSLPLSAQLYPVFLKREVPPFLELRVKRMASGHYLSSRSDDSGTSPCADPLQYSSRPDIVEAILKVDDRWSSGWQD